MWRLTGPGPTSWAGSLYARCTTEGAEIRRTSFKMQPCRYAARGHLERSVRELRDLRGTTSVVVISPNETFSSASAANSANQRRPHGLSARLRRRHRFHAIDG